MSHLPPAHPSQRKRRQRAIADNADRLPSHAEMVDNLLTILGQASPDAEAEGLGWYASAHSVAADIAADTGCTVTQAAGVIAALSPQTGWAENVRLAHEACAHAANGRTDLIGGHTADACRKASAILQGADPSTILGGRKVRSFYRNVSDPTRSGAVTIDRHAVDMLCGRRGAVHDRALERPGVYARCAAVIRHVARLTGHRPHEVQAVAWITWRQVHDVAYRYDLTDL